MHEFPEDFYGATLKIVLLGEIRKMTTFNSLGTLNKDFSID
jgi:FAD synthase